MTLIIRTISAFFAVGAIFGAYPSAQSTGATNTLTAAEKSAGWNLLFDGTSMNGWRGYKKPDVSGLRWKADDGCLALPPAEGADTHGQRDIITIQLFDDFDLTWQWRIGKGGNSDRCGT